MNKSQMDGYTDKVDALERQNMNLFLTNKMLIEEKDKLENALVTCKAGYLSAERRLEEAEAERDALQKSIDPLSVDDMAEFGDTFIEYLYEAPQEQWERIHDLLKENGCVIVKALITSQERSDG